MSRRAVEFGWICVLVHFVCRPSEQLRVCSLQQQCECYLPVLHAGGTWENAFLYVGRAPAQCQIFSHFLSSCVYCTISICSCFVESWKRRGIFQNSTDFFLLWNFFAVVRTMNVKNIETLTNRTSDLDMTLTLSSRWQHRAYTPKAHCIEVLCV